MSILECSVSELIQITESINLTTECLEIRLRSGDGEEFFSGNDVKIPGIEADDFYHALHLAISAYGPGDANGREGDAIR